MICAMVKKELMSYFSTPLAYVFMVIFLIMMGSFTFFFGQFYERNQADLSSFFHFHPWLYLFLIPALSMRLWAEERKTGTIELLMTLPVSLWQVVFGKFFAAWLFSGIALILTFPLWITVNYLGNPDNGAILAGYVGSWLLAGGFLSVGSCLSAVTSNQVIAFIITVVACFLLVVSGFPMVLDWLNGWAGTNVVDAIASLSFLEHFRSISKGVLDLRDIFFFLIIIAAGLTATCLVVQSKKASS